MKYQLNLNQEWNQPYNHIHFNQLIYYLVMPIYFFDQKVNI